jgi:hypothetical protein
VLHAFAASVVVGELEGVESSEDQENSINFIVLGRFSGHKNHITQRLPKCAWGLIFLDVQSDHPPRTYLESSLN